MKLSQFKTKPTQKKIMFKSDGTTEIIRNKDIPVGEINFKETDLNWIQECGQQFIDTIDSDTSEEEIALILMSLITDIEVDVTVDEFKVMVSNPNPQLISLINMLTEVFEQIQSTVELIVKTMKETNPEVLEDIDIDTESSIIEVKEVPFVTEEVNEKDEIDVLLEKLENEPSREKRMAILKTIAELQEI